MDECIGNVIYFLGFTVLIEISFFGIILDWQKSCKDTTEFPYILQIYIAVVHLSLTLVLYY